MRVIRGMSRYLCIVIIAVDLLRALRAERRASRSEYRSGSRWPGWMVQAGKAFNDILVKDGYNVSIVQEPLTSLSRRCGATKRILAQQNGRCILVAHSYGGSVITEAGTDPSVAGLVYIAAHMPDAGESEAGDGKALPKWTFSKSYLR